MSGLQTVVAIALGIVWVSPLEAQAPQGANLASMQEWDIVLDEEASPSEAFAAEEFRDIFSRASGVKLPIVQETGRRSDKHVFIGPGEALTASEAGFSIEGFGEEDFRIIIRDGNIAIAGGRQRGTLYGVYTFLEDYLGVRFLTHDHTHVPPVGDWRVVGPVDRFDHPPLEFRWSAYKENEDHPAFAARLRCNTVTDEAKLGGSAGTVLFNHSVYRYVQTKVYGKEHPEYFAMVDGERLAQVKNDAQHTELCLTNPDVLQIVTQAVLDELARNPEKRSISVSQSDSGLYCHCPACSAINEREESGMGTVLTFVNAVADAVAKRHPRVKVGTLAYYYSQKPPKSIKPRLNVIIQLTSHDCSITDPIRDSDYEASMEFRRDLEGWGRICDHINLWYYNLHFGLYLLPVPNMRTTEPDIRFFAANHIKGMFVEGAYNGSGSNFSDLRNYVVSQLLWDPNQSGRQLMDTFLDLHYGEAAPPIRRYIDLLHDNAEAKGIQEAWWGEGKDYGLDESIVSAGLEAFEEAMKLADDEVVLARVEKASICAHMAAVEEAVQWTWGKLEPSHRRYQGNTGQEMPPELKETRSHFRRMLELCSKYGVTHFSEQIRIERAGQYWKQGYGIAPDEPW